ncbi:uncharacterized protein DUF1648 [Homoserinimonas aerilata]|uniref:Uncharacterized protein DUF1648 n=1 Tax=Homoserinimonas aerilata TaxID=1162970 RepID=A0A542YI56_9MICO|nr:DUF1648 domain-containing protein [Homoserinimonas aerilata]TQL47773.1 uncharacterized protein DUF1648 [Homoserinimonas aerilata]
MTQQASASLTDTARATRTRVLLVGVVVPVFIAAVATAICVAWLPELPDPIAIHWGANGQPDGYGSAWMSILMPLVLTIFFCGIAVASSWRLTPSGRIVWTQRFVLATGTWLAMLISVIAVGTLAQQRGLDDAAQTGTIGGIMAIGFGVATLLAVGAWFLLPAHDSARLNAAQAAEPLPAAPGELIAWSRTAHIATPALLILAGAILLVVGTVVVCAVAAPEGLAISVIALIVVLFLAAVTAMWRVTADRRGLTVRSVLGWPRQRIRLEDMTDVSVTTVDPMAEFGGWGWRWGGDRRSGVVLRHGSAIEVTRASGRRFVITVDDAETGASVLAALRARD